MKLDTKLEKFNRKTIHALWMLQSEDGSFESVVSSSRSFKFFEKSNTTFYTSVILSSLNCAISAYESVGGLMDRNCMEELSNIRKRAANFLLSQCSSVGSFNYHRKSGGRIKSRIQKTYPDDLDDTALALYAISGYNTTLLTPELIAKLMKLLIFCEAEVGGPYYTWIISQDHPTLGKDLDCIVNINVRTLLNSLGVVLPNLENFAEKSANDIHSHEPYYYDKYARLYFASRVPERPISVLLRRKFTAVIPSSSLPFALLANILYHHNEGGLKLNALLKRFSDDFLRRNYPFGVEYIEKNVRHFSTAPALTITLSFEACAHAFAGEHKKKEIVKNAQDAEILLEYALERIKIASHNSFLARRAADLISSRFSKEERDSILILPFDIWRSLPNAKKISRNTVRDLSIAGLYGWVGYAVVDDVLDKDATPKDLPQAMMLIRLARECYLGFANTPQIKSLVDEIFMGMDEAAAWEQHNCYDLSAPPDFGDYSILAKRSMGHAIGPLLLLARSNLSKREKFKAIDNIQLYFKHYIIARQLNDDAHDWSEDLEKGLLNSVSSFLIKETRWDWRRADGANLDTLREYFWKFGVSEISNVIFQNIDKAEKSIKSLAGVIRIDPLRVVLMELREKVVSAVEEHKNTNNFLDAYKSKANDS